MFTFWLRYPPKELEETDFIFLDFKDYGDPGIERILKFLRIRGNNEREK